jgi:GTPase SAR1 family protein
LAEATPEAQLAAAMGQCCSQGSNGGATDRGDKSRTREIEKAMRNDFQKDAAVNKLLLLGAGESGKSTLFKQMVSIYGAGFSKIDLASYTRIIHNNALIGMQTLLQQSHRLAGDPYNLETAINPALEADKKAIMELKMDDQILPEHAEKMKRLWQDAGVQLTFANRSRYQMSDSVDYFLNRVEQLAAPDYLPSEDDVLRSRARTTGIVEQDFVIDNNYFRMVDVGGQRNERKKWIHCFDSITAVLFVAALSEYDMVLFEDETTNRMDEAINLFKDICNSKWFTNASMILMLNKRDLFAAKIQKVPLTVWRPDYAGPNSYEDACLYIQDCFESVRADATRPIYTHITCATDKDNMRMVFNAVKDTVIRKSLQEGGLLA